MYHAFLCLLANTEGVRKRTKEVNIVFPRIAAVFGLVCRCASSSWQGAKFAQRKLHLDSGLVQSMRSIRGQHHALRLADGTTLHAKVYGDEDSIEKPVLITHHGAPGASDGSEAAASFAHLSNRYRVITFDARGSGRSASANGPYSIAQWVQDLEEVRRWSGAESVVVGGGSYGAAIALAYGLEYKEHVRALVLRGAFADGRALVETALSSFLDPPGRTAKPVVDRERQERLWQGNLRSDQDFAAAMHEISGLFAAEKTEAVSIPFPDVASFHARTFNGAFGQQLRDWNVLPRLHQLGIPTLVAVGRHDLITPVAASESISRCLPGSKLVVFAHSGHSPPTEEPDSWRERLDEFLVTL